jgi:ubiquinone/menaquinone biosynthesis C-methylase UbiE
VKFGFTKDTKVLDMGCGTGMVAMHLKNIAGVESMSIIGMDASDGMIEKAKKKELYSEIHNNFLC